MRGESRIEIGGVARAHGIRGEVVIITHDPDSDTLGSATSIFVGGVERKILKANAEKVHKTHEWKQLKWMAIIAFALIVIGTIFQLMR